MDVPVWLIDVLDHGFQSVAVPGFQIPNHRVAVPRPKPIRHVLRNTDHASPEAKTVDSQLPPPRINRLLCPRRGQLYGLRWHNPMP
ncbi:hypothetical protein D3C78_1868260 [compost metagenome]